MFSVSVNVAPALILLLRVMGQHVGCETTSVLRLLGATFRKMAIDGHDHARGAHSSGALGLSNFLGTWVTLLLGLLTQPYSTYSTLTWVTWSITWALTQLEGQAPH